MNAVILPIPRSQDHARLVDAADEIRAPFDAEYVDQFIREFAESEGDPICWLEDHGIGENYGKYLLGAELIRKLCGEWVKAPLVVYEIAGADFWRCMRELALTAYDAE